LEVKEEKEDLEVVDLAKFGSRILRGPKGGVYERILAQHLIESINAEPLHAILHVARAAMMLPKEHLNELEIDPGLVKVISFVVLKLINRPVILDEGSEEFRIDWSINNDEEYAEYIKPWVKKTCYSHYPQYKDGTYSEYSDTYKKARENTRDYFLFSSYHLTEMGYASLCSDFITWALPHIQRITEKLSQLIQPGTYAEILKLFGRPTPTLYHGERHEDRLGKR